MTTTLFDTTPTHDEISDARTDLLACPDELRAYLVAGYLGGAVDNLDGYVTDEWAAQCVARARAWYQVYTTLRREQVRP